MVQLLHTLVSSASASARRPHKSLHVVDMEIGTSGTSGAAHPAPNVSDIVAEHYIRYTAWLRTVLRIVQSNTKVTKMLREPVRRAKHEVSTNNHDEKQGVNFEDALYLITAGASLDSATAAVLKSLTAEEKFWLLDGDESFWKGLRGILFDRYNRKPFVMGAIPRLKIPGIRFTDGPRGIVMHSSTCFPVSMSRGATWDVGLEERIGTAIGVEGRAQGANYFAGICINLPRHPAWGRSQETYGEEPILLGEFGLALHRGVRKSLMTCVKHFALNSMENARFNVDVQASEEALHEVFLPHFRQLVEAGVSSVMSSYNSVRGEFAGENKELLDDILRKEWGFKGFVMSDFIFGLRDVPKSVKHGLDVEAPFRQQRALRLIDALDTGELEWADIETSCARILRTQLEHTARTGCRDPPKSVVACQLHRRLARDAAAQGITLLKNSVVNGKEILPLHEDTFSSVVLIGRLANTANTGDRGSSAVFPPKVVTFFEGVKAALPTKKVTLENGDDVEAAREAAASADVAICIVGYDATDEGEYVVPCFKNQHELLRLLPPTEDAEDVETLKAVLGEQHDESSSEEASDRHSGALVPGAGGDRESLRLRSRDVNIIRAVNSVNGRSIVAIVSAGAVIMNEWISDVPCALMAWYSGGEGGHAFADVLLGKVDASGRLPFSIAKTEEHLPFFDIHAKQITYDRWFGQRLLDRLGVEAQFPLGFGLSYTKFVLEDVQVNTSTLDWTLDHFVARIKITNVGERDGRHVLQVYGTPDVPEFPSRVLLGFQSVLVKSTQSRVIDIMCSIRPLMKRTRRQFSLADTVVGLEIGSYAGDLASLRTVLSM